ncbi:MAG: prepilin-type N-terminal cleavage/methylation domain-containing protein [Thioalkalivibrio sp.]|nr:prepilin-type N-terminal cleavage/methylation domain-containing protein [Thioalkalivibrio sp.]
MNKHQSGFTLVEIAIVLVIIGLLLGGVLKGQEMIANAKFRNLQSEIQSYAAAMYSFQDRFGALPGDMSAAAAQAQLDPAAPGGNNNGQIQGNNCSAAANESCRAWQHLRYANLIPGDPTLTGTNANPNHAYGGQVQGLFSATSGNRTGIWIQLQALSGDVAERLDRELDDSTANTGTVFCQTGCTGGNYPTDGSVVTLRVMI